MRLDKFIWNLWFWSRKQVTQLIKDWIISVNWDGIFNKDFEIKVWDIIWVWEENIKYLEEVYLMLNKPIWYVSSKVPEWLHKSYLDLLISCPYWHLVNLAWRLDFDTEWLLFLTNNGLLIHQITNPKKEVFKKYYVNIEKILSDKDIKNLESGLKIDEDIFTKPAKVEIIWEKEIYLSISEWRFHQVKKMLEAVNNKVLKLKRVSIWNLELWNLGLWEWKYLKKEEVDKIFI